MRTVCTSLFARTMPLILCHRRHLRAHRPALPLRPNAPSRGGDPGQANDFIVLPDGELLASCFLVIIMQVHHQVAHYRVVQEDKKSLTVQIVAGPDFEDAAPQRIAREISEATWEKLDVRGDTVAQILLDPSGKILTVISRVIPGLQERLSLERGAREDGQ